MKNTKTTKTAANTKIYRELDVPFMTIAGDNDTETTLNATVVAAIDPKTETKTYSFAVKRGTTGVKQDGTEWLKAGEKSEDGPLLGMNFYVAGVDDKLPQ